MNGDNMKTERASAATAFGHTVITGLSFCSRIGLLYSTRGTCSHTGSRVFAALMVMVAFGWIRFSFTWERIRRIVPLSVLPPVLLCLPDLRPFVSDLIRGKHHTCHDAVFTLILASCF